MVWYGTEGAAWWDIIAAYAYEEDNNWWQQYSQHLPQLTF